MHSVSRVRENRCRWHSTQARGHLSVCQSEDLQCIEPLTTPTAFLLKGLCSSPAEFCWVGRAILAPGEHSMSRQY